MDKQQAYDMILGDKRLGVVDKVVLQLVVKHMATDYICVLNKTQISEFCGVDRRVVRNSMNRMVKDGYLIEIEQNGHTPQYIPWPYCKNVIHTKDNDRAASRLTITPEQGHFLLGILTEKETTLTLIAREAQNRHDHAEHRRVLVQVDMVLDLKDTIGKFVERVAATVRSS